MTCRVSLQAISLLRQKKLDETVKSVNNLLACDKALPADRPVSWDERSELQDLFSTYVSRVRSQLLLMLSMPLIIDMMVAVSVLQLQPQLRTAKSSGSPPRRCSATQLSRAKPFTGRRTQSASHMLQESNQEKQAAVAQTLGIPDSEVDSLRQLVSSGSWKLEEEAADANSFF